MTRNKLCKLHKFLLVSVLAMPVNSFGQDLKIDTYVPPKIQKRAEVPYPPGPLRRYEEASVQVNLMIDPAGKPFEAVIEHAFGDKVFQKTVLDSLAEQTFTPATNNGEPVTGSMRMIVNFQINGLVQGARGEFVRIYNAFGAALTNGSKDEAEAAHAKLEKLGITNMYERAFFNFSKYLFSNKYGSSLEKMNSLNAALSFSRELKDDIYLPKAEAKLARRELLKQQIANKYYAEALNTFGYLELSKDDEGAAMFKPLVDKLREYQRTDSVYKIPATLDDQGHFDVGLFKHHVYIQDVSGKVNEFKLRCEKKYVGFTVEPEVSYNVPAEWGACTLEVIGDAGTTLQLAQQ